jgi:hypothetical protein
MPQFPCKCPSHVCIINALDESSCGSCADRLQACNRRFSLPGEHAKCDDVFDMEEPGFSPHICTRCPPNERFCPAHIDCYIRGCSRCDERACEDHSHDKPCWVLSCSTCNWALCLCDSCRRPEKRLLHCFDWDTDEGCLDTYCSDCCPSKVCPYCGRRMNE